MTKDEQGSGEGVGVSIASLLEAVGKDVLHRVNAIAPENEPVLRVKILDPDDHKVLLPGDIVFLIGVRGRAALPTIRILCAASHSGGPSAIIIKGTEREREQLRILAEDLAVPLLVVDVSFSWTRLDRLVRTLVQTAPDPLGGSLSWREDFSGDLFAVSTTLAHITGGYVSIEDASNRILAYSSALHEVDDLRLRSILGRQGPEEYVNLLRQWGVYHKLRSPERVVHVPAREDVGMSARLAVGIHAGDQLLGFIWVQESSEPLRSGSEKALLGAARYVAWDLVQRRSHSSSYREQNFLDFVGTPEQAMKAAYDIGLDPHKPGLFVLFFFPEDALNALEKQMFRSELAHTIAIFSSAFRRTSRVGYIESSVVLLIPEVDGVLANASVHPVIRKFVEDIVRDLRSRYDVAVQAAMGSVAPDMASMGDSLESAQQVMKILCRDSGVYVASQSDLWAVIAVDGIVERIREKSRFYRENVSRMVRDHPDAARLVLLYMECWGDISSVVRCLEQQSQSVHANTVRYRVRRALEGAGIDVSDADQRLAVHLQLRAELPPIR